VRALATAIATPNPSPHRAATAKMPSRYTNPRERTGTIGLRNSARTVSTATHITATRTPTTKGGGILDCSIDSRRQRIPLQATLRNRPVQKHTVPVHLSRHPTATALCPILAGSKSRCTGPR
jgi:hypothetical protein